MGAKGFGAGNFKALLESIERTVARNVIKSIILYCEK
jgi:4-hydroxyphenylpyruvate dioxygenase-like putative hemolysin